MLDFSRRHFVKLGIFTACAPWIGPAAQCWATQKGRQALLLSEQVLLTRYIDLLIPADQSPGALDLQVHLQVMEYADTKVHLIKQGVRWLNRAAQQLHGKNFF